MKAYGIPIDPPPRSTTNTQDELLVDIVDAPQMGISQPAAAYKQDAEVVYLPGGDQDFGRLPTMAKAEHGLHFTSVGFSVFDKGLPCMGGEDGEKKILTSVTGQVFRGETMAILGPSGAGKTTFLRCITGKTEYGRPSGMVDLDGKELTKDVFRKCCSYVEQEDSLPSLLTTRETLTYAAAFWMASSIHQATRVEEVLEQMRLKVCEGVRCGMLSGGQKRRVSVALALLKDPAVLFMDEPTSGLDSSSAWDVITCVKGIAVETGMIVVCTIHQPSSELFMQFSRAMILGKNGQVAFCGPTASLPAFLSEVGHAVPAGINVADFALNLVDCDPEDASSTLAKITTLWPQQTGKDRSVNPSAGTGHIIRSTSFRTSEGVKLGAGFLTQTWVHLRRQTVLAVRDPTLYTVRFVIYIGAAALFMLVYFDSRERIQTQVTNKVFLCMWFVAVPTCMSTAAIPSMMFEFRSIRKEVINGQYNPVSYFISNILVQAVGVFLLAVASLVMPYAASNWWGPNYPPMLVIFSVSLWTFESMAQSLAIAFAGLSIGPPLGMLCQICLWFAAFLFSGFFIRDAPLVITDVFEQASPLRWAMSSIMKQEIKDATWARAMGREYYCAIDSNPTLCFGRSGTQVLDTLENMFQTANSEDSFKADVFKICMIGLAFKLLVLALILWKTLKERLFTARN
ncbi:P-loop containing nucleoside triphosphate hydrolase protein [Baffinella frigidus]|nr:P-loop containing nucleoside triphosphate hydrolase protein [Cryptophyta sp. CCMP2293]